MSKFVYIGLFNEVDIPALGLQVPRDEPFDVPDELSGSFAVDDVFVVADSPTKSAGKTPVVDPTNAPEA